MKNLIQTILIILFEVIIIVTLFYFKIYVFSFIAFLISLFSLADINIIKNT